MIVLGTRLADQVSAWFMDSAVGSDPSRLAEAMVTIQSMRVRPVSVCCS